MANCEPPNTTFMLEAAKDQLSRHLAPIVFQYFEWSIDDDVASDRWILRGESHSRVELRTPLPSVREYEAGAMVGPAEKVEYYYPKAFHIAMAFEKHHSNIDRLKIAFDDTIARLVEQLKFLERAKDIQELEAWIILAQKPL